MIYIKTRKEHPFLSALEINYLQKQGTIFRLDSNPPPIGYEPIVLANWTISPYCWGKRS